MLTNWLITHYTHRVVYQVKDTIFRKQITTHTQEVVLNMLLFIKSKIQFSESKSQQLCHFQNFGWCCLSSQRYNFPKANHNRYLPLPYRQKVVYQVKDTIFRKQITTICGYKFEYLRCLSSQRYNFPKANHNHWLQG